MKSGEDSQMKIAEQRIRELEKLAYGFSPTVGISNPGPSVGNVLDYIGVCQAQGIGSQRERTDAFGRIINSGLVNSSPAGKAIRMIGGGLLGRAITGAFTNNKFIRGFGTGLGAVLSV